VFPDYLGNLHAPATDAARIVSLVPSITELLCALGLADQLVGRTGFCIHPRDTLRSIPKVGGTKDVDVDAVRQLRPSHLIVNIDENRQETVAALRQHVPAVVVTHPLGPDDNPPLYRLLGRIFGREAAAEALCRAYFAMRSRCAAETLSRPPQRVLYLIWRDPWMTVSRDTYISRTLELFGWHTWQPSDDEQRYPRLQLPQCHREVDRVLLSSEPFPFRAKHIAEVRAELPGIPVEPIDGEMVSWYGSRAIEGLAYLDRFTRCDGTDRQRRTGHD